MHKLRYFLLLSAFKGTVQKLFIMVYNEMNMYGKFIKIINAFMFQKIFTRNNLADLIHIL